MAIKKPMTLENGLQAPEAYHRVESVSMKKGVSRVAVASFARPPKAGDEPIRVEAFDLVHDLAQPVWPQAYAAAKTRAAFSGGEDV